MAREIKFRIFDKEYKTMKYPNSYVLESCWFGVTTEHYLDDSGTCSYPLSDKQFAIMQSTGITDSKGKEIWEGDIIKCGANDYTPTELYWDDDMACYAVSTYHATLQLADVRDKNIEVIGNIYENPELLK